MPPNPPNKAHGFAMRSMSLRDMQIPKSEKKILGPPLPNPGDAPEDVYYYYTTHSCMQRIANNVNILKSHCYVTSNLQFVTQKYSKCSDPYTLLCDIIM